MRECAVVNDDPKPEVLQNHGWLSLEARSFALGRKGTGGVECVCGRKSQHRRGMCSGVGSRRLVRQSRHVLAIFGTSRTSPSARGYEFLSLPSSAPQSLCIDEECRRRQYPLQEAIRCVQGCRHLIPHDFRLKLISTLPGSIGL